MNRFLPSLKKIAAAPLTGAGWVPLPPCSPRPRSHPTYNLISAKFTGFTGLLLSVPLFFLVFGGIYNPPNANINIQKQSIAAHAYNGTSCEEASLLSESSNALSDLPQSNNQSITTKSNHSNATTYPWRSSHRPRARDENARASDSGPAGIPACFDVRISAKTKRGNDLSY
jgi:hypothetical protein